MGVPQLPAGLRWSHNTYYHRWVLRQLPAHFERALDVGCGAGSLARKLAQRADHVDAVDVSPEMIAAARQCDPREGGHVRWILGDVLDHGLPLARGGYDVVTAVSSLHHLPLQDGIERLGALVAPGGLLLVVGHYRATTLSDHCWGVAALAANAAVGCALAVAGRAGTPDDAAMPVRPPDTTLTQIRRSATAALPGARVTRGLHWRYLLRWHRPPDLDPPPPQSAEHHRRACGVPHHAPGQDGAPDRPAGTGGSA